MSLLFLNYLQANLLIVGGYFTVRVIQMAVDQDRIASNRSTLLWIARTIFLCIWVFPGLLSQLRFGPSFIIPSAQLWQASSMHEAGGPEAMNILTVGDTLQRPWVLNYTAKPNAYLIALFVAALFIVWFSRAFWKLNTILCGSHRLRRLGRVEIRVSDKTTVPFSYFFPGTAYVMLPTGLLENREAFMVVVRHEIQHHRQRDTLWSYVGESFRCLFFFNPFSHLFLSRLSEIQELACDEALILQRNVSPHVYGSCLLRVAETARGIHPVLVGTTSMAVNPSGSFLKRRIVYMLNVKSKKYPKTWSGLTLLGVGVLLMTGISWASNGLVLDRRVTLEDAKALASKNSSFPITVNEAVVRELNRYVGTPDGREFIKNSLARMENYRPMIERKLSHYNLPKELMAMPIMESGYQNLPQNPNPMHSAGVWQFIPQTARNFGLRVDATVDERMNVELETDAACRYLGALNYQFQNWELAVMAYNAGEYQVQRGISKTGSKNAWVLIDKGFTGDKGYLAKMTAAVLILNNPKWVE